MRNIQLHIATDAECRGEGAGLRFRWVTCNSPYGRCFLAAAPRGICRIVFLDQRDPGVCLTGLKNDWPRAEFVEEHPEDSALPNLVFDPTALVVAWVKATEFQAKVWQALLDIPRGKTISYGELAQRIGRPGGARAVGQAVGANPVPFIVPCHRVIRSDGALGGYGGGVKRKKAMLADEGVGLGAD